MLRTYLLRSPLLVAPLLLAACSGAPTEDVESSGTAVSTKCGASDDGGQQGIDVSYAQDEFDWSAHHVDFAFTRVSYGKDFVDDQFDRNWSEMKAHGIRRGVYQYFLPSESATEQANLLVSKVGKLGKGDLPAMIDVEETDGLSGHEMATAIRTWLETVEKGTGLRPIIYTGSYFWQDNVGATDFGDYPLSIADYGPSCPLLPPGWKDWTFWQYSDGDGKLDHDVFNGSSADLDKLEGGQEPAPAGNASPSVVKHEDGYLEVFDRGKGDALYHFFQEASHDGRWSSWDDLDGVLASEPVVALNRADRAEVFAVNDKKELVHKWTEASGSWSGWASLGGSIVEHPVVVKDGDGRLHVFARGASDELETISESATGSWGKWDSLGEKLLSLPSVAINEDGRLEVFGLGEDGVPHHVWQEEKGGWSGWDSLGGTLSLAPTAVTDTDGRLEVFGVSPNHEIYRDMQKTPGGEWTGWHSLGGYGTSHVAVGTNKDGRLEIFVKGKDDGIDHAWIREGTDEFSGFESLGGKFTSDPAVALNKSGGLEAFGRGTNDELYHAWQDSKDKGGWTGWSRLGGDVE